MDFINSACFPALSFENKGVRARISHLACPHISYESVLYRSIAFYYSNGRYRPFEVELA